MAEPPRGPLWSSGATCVDVLTLGTTLNPGLAADHSVTFEATLGDGAQAKKDGALYRVDQVELGALYLTVLQKL